MTTKILILDDDEDLLELMTRQLASQPYEARFFDSGLGALIAIFKAYEDRQPFDALVLDCALPRFDGFTIAKMVRLAESTGIAPRVKIGFLTAYTSTVDKSTLLAEVGADAYWRKPEDIEELPRLISQLLAVSG